MWVDGIAVDRLATPRRSRGGFTTAVTCGPSRMDGQLRADRLVIKAYNDEHSSHYRHGVAPWPRVQNRPGLG